MTDDFTENYQWKFRPQHPARPNWFRAWPGEAQISVQIIVLPQAPLNSPISMLS
jgi:hypothetical protein